MKVKVIHDSGEVYKDGEIVDSKDIIQDYIDGLNASDPNDAETIEWLKKDNGTYALAFIGNLWGIDFEFCGKN
jgi:hypothetical protein